VKTTEERIEEIMDTFTSNNPKFIEIDRKILRLRLETLVVQAQLEELQKK
jgi:hypothetical protein